MKRQKYAQACPSLGLLRKRCYKLVAMIRDTGFNHIKTGEEAHGKTKVTLVHLHESPVSGRVHAIAFVLTLEFVLCAIVPKHTLFSCYRVAPKKKLIVQNCFLLHASS